MRIETIPQPPVRLFADSRSPATSFVDMVSDPQAHGGDRASQGALGFQALGMFGRQEAVEYVGGTLAPLEPLAPEASSPPPLSVTARADWGATIIGRAASPGTQGDLVNPAKEIPVQPALRTTQAERSTADGLLIEATVPDTGNEETRPQPAAGSRSRKSPARPETQVRLALFRTGSGVSVTVIAPGLSVCDIQRFRERAEALLRDHGMLLDKVAVNGEGRIRGDASQGSQEQWR